MTNCSKVWRGLKLRGASAGSSGPPPTAAASAACPPRRPVVAGGDELDRGPAAEDRAGEALEEVAEALLDPRPDPLGGDDDEGAVLALVARQRLEPLVPGGLRDRPLQLRPDQAPAGWMLVVVHGSSNVLLERRHGAERGSGGGPIGPGART